MLPELTFKSVCKQGAVAVAAVAWLGGLAQHMAAHRRATLLLTIYDTIYVTFFEDYPPKTTNYDQ